MTAADMQTQSTEPASNHTYEISSPRHSRGGVVAPSGGTASPALRNEKPASGHNPTGDSVPIGGRNGLIMYSRRALQSLAEDVLRQLLSEQFAVPYPHPTDCLAAMENYFGLLVRFAPLGPKNYEPLGVSVFSDTAEVVVIGEDGRPDILTCGFGTVLLSTELQNPGAEGRLHFTQAHELAHWVLHRNYLTAGEGTAFRERGGLVCRSIGDGRRPATNRDWMEWQADVFASALLMPESSFLPFAKTVIYNAAGTDYLLEHCDPEVTHRVISTLCAEYAVSPSATRHRLRDFGLLRSLEIR